jgi:PPOX class probable FMN-dependent enzyme
MPEITTVAALRELLGEPSELVKAKVTDRLNELTRRFIDLSPFVLLATSHRDGSCDVSPRGDPAGFVQVVDDQTLLVPERPGNRLADSLENILRNPHVGLLFLVPGVGETLRVNGRGRIVTDEDLLEPLAVEGKPPRLGLLIRIDQVFTHCPKAFIRSDLWNPERFRAGSDLPSPGAIHRSLNAGFDAESYDAERAERYARREGLY